MAERCNTHGKDMYGHFVLFGDFRAAMPDGKTAREAAVASEMLEALIKIVKYADSEPESETFVEMHRANIERARAVIAKAQKEVSNG